MNNSKGFTLIEMIGVLAIISILAAMVVPKIFDSIQDSKATRIAAESKVYAAAITKWYKDVGVLAGLSNAGAAAANDNNFQIDMISTQGNTAGLWSRWRGPYIDNLPAPPVGTAVRISNMAGLVALAANNDRNYDFDDDGVGELSTTNRVASLVITGVLLSDFVRVDSIIDSGGAVATRATRGRVKYSGTTMRIYLVHL